MNKKTLVTFIGIYLFFYILNYLYPLCFGDDYLYSFVWQGNPMGFPLTEEAKRVSSFNDLFVSQYSLYFTWGGRIVGQTLTQLFMWLGKGTFNIFNALISTLLVAEIYWISNKGSISAKFSLQRVCWIFFVIWAFSPGFSPLFLWLTCACVYIWLFQIEYTAIPLNKCLDLQYLLNGHVLFFCRQCMNDTPMLWIYSC